MNPKFSIPGSWEQVDRGPKTIAGIPKARRRSRIVVFQEEYGYDEERDVHTLMSNGAHSEEADTREKTFVVVEREHGMSRMPIQTPLKGMSSIVELTSKETQTGELADY